MRDPNAVCEVDNCNRPVNARGLCRSHYNKAHRSGTLPPRTKTPEFCSIEGCGRPHAGRGLCMRCLKRVYRNGAPVLRTQQADVLRQLAAIDTDDCTIWPHNLKPGGYPDVKFERKSTTGHRLVCRWAHGEPPTPMHEAAHSCGVRACVNPKHLRWATGSENQADRMVHGTAALGESHPSARLTEADVLAIRTRYRNGETARQIAPDYPMVSYYGIWDAMTGRSWAHLVA